MKPFSIHELFHDRYRLLDYLGGGELAEVWLATDELTDRQIVVKIYVKVGEAGIRQFKNDFNLTYTLNHPNILKPDYMGVYDRRPYLLMPYCEKKSLFRQIDTTLGTPKLFTERDAANLIVQIGGALSYLHKSEVIHRDIKPDNILIGDNNQYLLTDFGISKKMRTTLVRATTSTESEANRLSFSAPYAPPEVFTLTEDPKKDIFSFGVTLFEMLTGELPFGDDGGRVLNHGASVPDLSARFSSQLNLLLKWCMHADPLQRPGAGQLEKTGRYFLNVGKWPVLDPTVETYHEVIERAEPLFQTALEGYHAGKDVRRSLQHVVMLYEKALDLLPENELATQQIAEVTQLIGSITERRSTDYAVWRKWPALLQGLSPSTQITTLRDRLSRVVGWATGNWRVGMAVVGVACVLVFGVFRLMPLLNGPVDEPIVKRLPEQNQTGEEMPSAEKPLSVTVAAQAMTQPKVKNIEMSAPLKAPSEGSVATNLVSIMPTDRKKTGLKPVAENKPDRKEPPASTAAATIDRLLDQGEQAIEQANDKAAAIGFFNQARSLSQQHNQVNPRFQRLYGRYVGKGDVIFDADEVDFARQWYEVAQALQHSATIRQKIDACQKSAN